MSLLRFDPAGALVPVPNGDATGNGASGEISPSCLRAQIEQLDPVRHRLTNHCGERVRAGFDRPERLLIEYEALRERSELGRVFRVANRLHDHLDAVGVIGTPECMLAPDALMRACCEPYHNELSRSARGSKPRMYFASSGIDNDAVEGLLRRLNQEFAANESDHHGPEDRYAIIPIDLYEGDRSGSAATDVFLRHGVDQVARSLGEADARWLTKLIVPVLHERSGLSKIAGEIDCSERFVTPCESTAGASRSDQLNTSAMMGGPFGVYSAATLLPAAFLGLDCIQFLLGASAMNDHFIQSPLEENMVLQYVGLQRLLATRRGLRDRMLVYWNPSLGGVSRWHQEWMSQVLDPTVRSSTRLQHGAAWAESLAAETVGNQVACNQSANNQSTVNQLVITQLIVESVRTDPIEMTRAEISSSSELAITPPGDHASAGNHAPPMSATESTQSGSSKKKKKAPGPGVPVIPDLMQSAISRSRVALRSGGVPAIELILPEVNTHLLGQLFQFWWLCSAVEREGDTGVRAASVHNTAV
ncbi:glucose-6-phosphate isomerase [Rhodopirellula sallentina]|uniref:Glucose-6-phosphate isomerase n=1 Tax=Rhodopirellula sallentina SM41 TaxID=1263870 RepID=M5U7E7_9BACT|nr:glucose-6-phosphate isomerase [Rhodopirellula sallentina]EMI57360.1 glucose-6-phosphate isomerase [Rhodopirellula sallentina SM41]